MTRITELSGHRELLVNLTMRELRSKYKRSVIGWGWSLLNPLFTVAIYGLVFGVFLDVRPPTGDPSGLGSFVLFLLCALLPWAYFQSTVDVAPEVLIANGNLIKKVYFPRQILVIAAVNAQLVTFLIEVGVLSVVLLIVGNMVLPWLPMLVVLLVIQSMFVLGVALLLSTLNVYFRDVKHLTRVAMMALFYATPIVYPLRYVPRRADLLGIDVPLRDIYELNPLVRMVGCYRDVLYDLRFPPLGDLLYFGAWSVALFALGWWVFTRLEGRIAEEV